MANDSSEEKSLPASKKKLEDARKKGQVPNSKDMVTACALIGALGYLWSSSGTLIAQTGALFTVAGDHLQDGLWPGLSVIAAAIGSTAEGLLGPLFAMVVIAVVLGNIIVLRGVVFAIEPITPKMSNVNPAEGFQRLFKMKALVELVKSLLKMVMLAAVLIVVLSAGLRSLVLLPACGADCIGPVFGGLARPVIGAAILLFLIAGLADIGLQRWLFMRDQKMGVSEAKRERKESEGDPMLRSQRKREQREATSAPAGRLGIARATLLLHDGVETVVGLRFKRGETPVPVVVCRGIGDTARHLLAEASRAGLPVATDPDLARLLAKRAPPGNFIPENSYQAAAMALSRAGLV